MAEPEKKSLIDFEWDLFDEENPETAVKPPDDPDGRPDKPPEPEIDEDDDWP